MRHILITTVLCLAGCFRKAPEYNQYTTVTHELLDSLLKQHVDEDGMVSYEGFAKDYEILKRYLSQLSENPPSESWSEDEKLAYWINAYNAFTIDLILRYKPTQSIKDITAINIPFVSSPWQIDFIEIGGSTYNLDDIEHGIIRRNFNEPRIHFALVCAAYSCPKLRREAYQAVMLNRQLTSQAFGFLADVKRNQITPDNLKISRIFQWYGGDFTHDRSLIDYLNQYAPMTIQGNARVEYMEYDWRLNTQE